MRDGASEYVIRPVIADIVTDTQLIKLVEIMKNKSSESAFALAGLLSALKAVLSEPYFPKTVFSSKKTISFNYKGQSYIVDLMKSMPGEQGSTDSDTEMDVDTPQVNNGMNRPTTHTHTHPHHHNPSFPPPQHIQPTIADIVTDDQFIMFVQLLREKAKESPRKLASILAAIKAVLDDAGLRGYFFQSKAKFFHGDENALREFIVEFDDGPPHQHQTTNDITTTANNNNASAQRLPFVVPLIPPNQTIATNGSSFEPANMYNVPHDVHEDMDELKEDEIVVDDQINNDVWRHTHISIQTPHHPHHNTIPPLNKRKRASSTNSEEDNFIHHTAPNAQSAKRRAPEKHKAPPLSCEAVKRLFVSISKTTLTQRLEESKTLISGIKETYTSINQSSVAGSTSPRLNLLCHLLQSPPTSRIDGISSKVFSNLELYKLFTTYNAYKDELGQKNHPEGNNNNGNNSSQQMKRNQSSGSPSSDPSSSVLPYPTYSSFIDPTVTLHIKEQTNGKEVGKHRLNCAWRLSILCELLGKGVLLMTKELSGAKLERILVEEFSKLIEFLKNPDNHDWVANIREKLDLSGFDEVYAPLAEVENENGNVPMFNVGGFTTSAAEVVDSSQQSAAATVELGGMPNEMPNEIGIIVPYDDGERPDDHTIRQSSEGEDEEGDDDEDDDVVGGQTTSDSQPQRQQSPVRPVAGAQNVRWKSETGRRY